MNTAMNFCLLVLHITLYTQLSVARQHINTDILNLNFSMYKESQRGYIEHVSASSDVAAINWTVAEGDNSLTILRLTNGSMIVELIFSPSTKLEDCLVSTSKKHI